MVIDFIVPPAWDGARLERFLRAQGVSLALLRSLKILPLGLMLNGLKAHTNAAVRAGDVASLGLPEPERHSARPEALPLALRYQSRDALVVNKPAGMVTHPGPSHPGGTLANAFCHMEAARGRYGAFRPVGRLDGGTSGLALLALNAAAAPRLCTTARKVYLALATGAMPPGYGITEAPLAPQPGSTVRQQTAAEGRPSRTAYRVLQSVPQASLLAVWPVTGRTHQIRAHLAALGHPLLGDALYGGSTALLRRHALHCAALAFAELGGNRPRLLCPPPADLSAAGAALGLDTQLFYTMFTHGPPPFEAPEE